MWPFQSPGELQVPVLLWTRFPCGLDYPLSLRPLDYSLWRFVSPIQESRFPADYLYQHSFYHPWIIKSTAASWTLSGPNLSADRGMCCIARLSCNLQVYQRASRWRCPIVTPARILPDIWRCFFLMRACSRSKVHKIPILNSSVHQTCPPIDPR